MKIKGVSFSKYKVNVDLYQKEKLDLFSFLFTRVIFNNKLDKNMKLVDCLNDLDIKEDLFYLFNNVYYSFIDNKIVNEIKEDINDLTLKDIKIDPRFYDCLNNNCFPRLTSSINKEFVYDSLLEKLVLEKEQFSDSNVVVFSVDNDSKTIEKLINNYKKGLFNEDVEMCLLNNYSVDPYYFEFSLENKDDYYFSKDNKEIIYKALTNNSLFINDEILKGNILTNNIYFSCLYSKSDLNEYCDYLFKYDKNKEFEVIGNIIYVGYEFDDTFIDLTNKESYKCGKYLLENKEYVSTFNKDKINISEFKLYLMKNKDKFSSNISKVIELFQEVKIWIITRF